MASSSCERCSWRETRLNLIIPVGKLCEKVHSGKNRGHFVSYHDNFSVSYQDMYLGTMLASLWFESIFLSQQMPRAMRFTLGTEMCFKNIKLISSASFQPKQTWINQMQSHNTDRRFLEKWGNCPFVPKYRRVSAEQCYCDNRNQEHSHIYEWHWFNTMIRFTQANISTNLSLSLFSAVFLLKCLCCLFYNFIIWLASRAAASNCDSWGEWREFIPQATRREIQSNECYFYKRPLQKL